MQKILLLSKAFDYANVITIDVGSGYARSMGWSYDDLTQINSHQDKINIIDNRITESECCFLEEYIVSHPDVFFLLKVIDPFKEWCQNHWYYRFLFRVKDRRNVYFLSTYLPAELVQELNEATGGEKMVCIPYAFNDTHAVDPRLSNRTHQIIFSGNQDRYVYPYRYQFSQSVRRNVFLWNKVHFLKHPGYPDIHQKLLHSFIGEKYVEYLAQFKFMFISPSRCGLEFLKYSECAYARCVPVGKLPLSFDSPLKDLFLELDFDNLARSLKRVFSMPLAELEDLADKYYFHLSRERNPALLNAQLDHFLEGVVQ
ncbi:MAG: hypothetical protein HY785_17605 [Oscillatoriophycideae cyanobacterium NC_groundwater_1537_Pr4_S-0.65um_50_18]|nr:hypothetical protein [Oscillatoriophycideae cyanobacterium NC_groundwater_1537_Pr4_S-0.65um_50_18]